MTCSPVVHCHAHGGAHRRPSTNRFTRGSGPPRRNFSQTEQDALNPSSLHYTIFVLHSYPRVVAPFTPSSFSSPLELVLLLRRATRFHLSPGRLPPLADRAVHAAPSPGLGRQTRRRRGRLGRVEEGRHGRLLPLRLWDLRVQGAQCCCTAGMAVCAAPSLRTWLWPEVSAQRGL